MAPGGQYVFAEMLGISEHFTAGSHEWLPYSDFPTFPKQSAKLVFSGQGPRPMRHKPWVVNQHPLGPSTDTAQENCFQNPYDATVGAAISRPKGYDL